MFTLYGALAALSLAAMLAVTWFVLHRKGVEYGAFIRFAVLCVPFAFIGSRAAFCLSNLSYYLETISMPEMMFHVQDGGASITGALAGVLLSALIASKWTKLPAGTLLDGIAFGMPAALVIERLAEPLWEMGWGKYFQSTAFDFMYDLTNGMHPVFAYEAMIAAVIGLAMVLYSRKHAANGDAMGFFLVLYGCTQTVLESLRNDGHMKVIHFVRVNQVAAIAMAVIVLILWSIRCVKARRSREAISSWLLTVVCIGFGVVQEFAADGDENPYFSLTLVSGILAVLLVIASFAWFFIWRKHGLKSADIVPAASLLTAVMLLIERTTDTGNHRLFFVYGIMAANLYIIGHMAFALRRLAAKKE